MRCKIIPWALFLFLLLACPAKGMCKTIHAYMLPAHKYYSRDFSAFPKWGRILQIMAHESLLPVASLSQLENRPLADQAQIINDAVNAYPFIDDITKWGKSDYWQTPAEFVASGGGDCEDFAITKYFMLQKLGIPEDRMNILIAYDNHRRQLHALLILDTGDGPLALDSQQGASPARYTPIYSFNRMGWQHY